MGKLRDHRAVVTGASAGLGEAMARQLASRGCDLVITARRGELLEALAIKLREQHDIDVVCVPLDLTESDAPARLVDAAYEGGRDVDILINNAGFGLHAKFADSDLDRQMAVMQLNMCALVELTRRFLDRMRARDKRGYIGNISSMVGYFAVRRMSVYGATKAFVRSFTESLHFELRGTNVSATCISLGATDTDFNSNAGIEVGGLYRPFLMSARRAAKIAVNGILRRRRNIVPGALNRLVALSTWLMPRRFMSWVLGVLLGKPKPAASREP